MECGSNVPHDSGTENQCCASRAEGEHFWNMKRIMMIVFFLLLLTVGIVFNLVPWWGVKGGKCGEMHEEEGICLSGTATAVGLTGNGLDVGLGVFIEDDSGDVSGKQSLLKILYKDADLVNSFYESVYIRGRSFNILICLSMGFLLLRMLVDMVIECLYAQQLAERNSFVVIFSRFSLRAAWAFSVEATNTVLPTFTVAFIAMGTVDKVGLARDLGLSSPSLIHSYARFDETIVYFVLLASVATIIALQTWANSLATRRKHRNSGATDTADKLREEAALLHMRADEVEAVRTLRTIAEEDEEEGREGVISSTGWKRRRKDRTKSTSSTSSGEIPRSISPSGSNGFEEGSGGKSYFIGAGAPKHGEKVPFRFPPTSSFLSGDSYGTALRRSLPASRSEKSVRNKVYRYQKRRFERIRLVTTGIAAIFVFFMTSFFSSDYWRVSALVNNKPIAIEGSLEEIRVTQRFSGSVLEAGVPYTHATPIRKVCETGHKIAVLNTTIANDAFFYDGSETLQRVCTIATSASTIRWVLVVWAGVLSILLVILALAAHGRFQYMCPLCSRLYDSCNTLHSRIVSNNTTLPEHCDSTSPPQCQWMSRVGIFMVAVLSTLSVSLAAVTSAMNDALVSAMSRQSISMAFGEGAHVSNLQLVASDPTVNLNVIMLYAALELSLDIVAVIVISSTV